MNILVLAGNIPATSRMAGCPRLFNFCRELSQRHDISLIAVNQSNERRKTFLEDPDSQKVFREITLLPLSPSFTWWNKQNHRLRLAPHFVTKFLQPAYYNDIRRRIDEAIVRKKPLDLVYVAGLGMTQYVEANPHIPAVLDLGDSKALLYKQMAMMEKRLWRKVSLHLETWSISRWERALGRYFALIVMTSKADESFMKKLAPYAPTMSISNGVDSRYFHRSNEPGNPLQLIFTGVMSYGPNEDAVVYFCKDIFPLIKKEYPSVQFWIVGKNPSPEVRALSLDRGVHVTGTVDDVRPYVQSAGVFVCPLRYGAGIKNKILAAMAMQKPIVATSLSLNEIDAKEDRDVLVADRPGDFAAKVVGIIKDQSLAERLGENARRLVLDRYSWKARTEVLEAAFQKVVADKKAFVDDSIVCGSEVKSFRLGLGASRERTSPK